MTEAQQLLLDIFGDATLTVAEARKRVFGNVTIDVESDYGKNRWFTELGNFKKDCAESLGILPPYPPKLSKPVKCLTSVPPQDFVVPDEDRLRDFIIDDKKWNYPALLAELEVLNGQKLWLSQAQSMLKATPLTSLVAKPLEFFDFNKFLFIVKDIISHKSSTTRKLAEKHNVSLTTCQILFNHLTSLRVTKTENNSEAGENAVIESWPTNEGLAAGLKNFYEPHKFGKIKYEQLDRKLKASIKRTLKDFPERYIHKDTFLTSLLCLDVALSSKKVLDECTLLCLVKEIS